MRPYLRSACVIGAFALSTVAIAPALAAAPVAQSGANAITLSVAGNQNASGSATATNDGSTETKSGQETPPVSVLGGQQVLNLGVLAQEATAGTDGASAACAGVAGNGGSVLQVGHSSCLNPGDPIGLSLTNLDLSKVLVFDPSSALGLLAAANPTLQTILGPTGNLADAIAATPLGTTGLSGTIGAIEGRCTARLGAATGDADIVDTELTVDIAGQKVVLARLPVHPAPNTHVPVDLSKATQVIVDAVSTQLTSMLAAPNAGTGPLAPLAILPRTVQDQVIEKVAEATKAQLLAPLGENVLDIVLNRQIRTGNDAIKVRALDLTALPAATAQIGAPLANLQIGNAACGPSGRIAAVAAPQAPAAPAAPAAIPTGVSAGYETAPAQYGAPAGDSTNIIVLGAFALLATTGAGFVAYRRLRD